jgi:DNA-binding LacI/PurR family transcriptional regulator
VEGLIIRPYPHRMKEVSTAVEQYRMPVVSVDYALTGEKAYDFVGTADEHGGQLAAEHLMKLGHRRIAVICIRDTESLQLRKRGCINALREQGLDEPVVLEEWNFENDEANQKLVKELLLQDEAPSAIFATGDFMLPTIYRVIHEMEITIPEDLSVIGFGDEEFCQYMIPPATTMHQDAYEIGVQAAQLLIDRVENADRQVPARQLRFEPYLALRDSTAGPKE